MSDDASEAAKASGNTNDAAVVQVREVAKWLIAAFAAVGALLAGGSQLSDLGTVTGLRLVLGFVAIPVVLIGVGLAIFKLVDVLLPKAITLKQLVDSPQHDEIRRELKDDPSLLLGHGTSVGALQTERNQQLEKEDAAWDAYEKDESDPKALSLAERASANRVAIDEAVTWLISWARYTETARLFRRTQKWMILAAGITAIGIGLFAWAAHPEDKDDETSAPVVAKSPTPITVDLSDEGAKQLGEKLGAGCDPNALAAIALGGEADALEVITVPNGSCALTRFTLTDTLGIYSSTEAAAGG